MSYASRQALLESDSDIEAVVTTAAFVSGISGRTHKPDSGFNDMLSRIAVANPSSPLAESHGDKGVKATKTREAVLSQKMRQLKSN